MSGHYTPDYAVAAVRNGAADCLAKPLNYPALESRIAGFMAESRRRRFVGELDKTLMEAFQLEAIVGRSPGG